MRLSRHSTSPQIPIPFLTESNGIWKSNLLFSFPGSEPITRPFPVRSLAVCDHGPSAGSESFEVSDESIHLLWDEGWEGRHQFRGGLNLPAHGFIVNGLTRGSHGVALEESFQAGSELGLSAVGPMARRTILHEKLLPFSHEGRDGTNRGYSPLEHDLPSKVP